MRLIRTWLILLLPLALASCMDTREEMEIKKDGSGTLALKTDMGKMVEMMKNFTNDSDIRKQGLDRLFDTTMLMKSYIDTVQGVSADKKAALRDGTLHLTLNVKENVGKFDMLFPFRSADQLSQIYQSLNAAAGGLKNVMGNLGGGSSQEQGDKGLPQLTFVYDVSVKNGVYSRKVNKERYDVFSQAMKLDQLKQMSSVMGAMNYTVVTTFPQPIKKTSNAKAVLSNNNKTATLSVDLLEAFEHPELLELEIEY
jgi:hypothetical protein